MTPAGLLDLTQRYQKLNQKNYFLIRLNKIVPWEEFRPLLEQIRHLLLWTNNSLMYTFSTFSLVSFIIIKQKS